MRPDPRYELAWAPQVPHSQTEHPETSALGSGSHSYCVRSLFAIAQLLVLHLWSKLVIKFIETCLLEAAVCVCYDSYNRRWAGCEKSSAKLMDVQTGDWSCTNCSVKRLTRVPVCTVRHCATLMQCWPVPAEQCWPVPTHGAQLSQWLTKEPKLNCSLYWQLTAD